MSDARSEAEWRASLLNRLNAELPRHTDCENRRIVWLAEHLYEFIERWIGFVMHPAVQSQPTEFLFQSGLFAVIGITLRLIDEEISHRPLDQRTSANWATLLTTHRSLLRTHNVGMREKLRLDAERFLAVLLSHPR